MNEWIGIGRLVKDPELSYTQSQTAKCTFTLAIDRPVRQGEEKQSDFIMIIAWNRQAETCGRYLRKGSQCAVRGSIRTGSYVDREGRTVYTTDIWANNVEFLGGNKSSERTENSAQNANIGRTRIDFSDMPDTFSAAEDDIPF